MCKELNEAIVKVADLARLELADKESSEYIDWAGRVIEYFEKLNELDTTNVEPTSHVVENVSFLRDDKVVKFEGSKEIIEQVPEVEAMLIKVPKVIP